MKNIVYAVVNSEVKANNFSHLYISFYETDESEMERIKDTPWNLPFHNLDSSYHNLVLNAQYGSGVPGYTRESTDPYGYRLSVSLRESEVYEAKKSVKLLERVTNRINKLMSTEVNDSSDPYLNYVSKAFKALKVKRVAVISSEDSKITWYNNPMLAVADVDSKIRSEIS